MYALDGPPRITHIWGFSSLEERAALRARFNYRCVNSAVRHSNST